MNKKNLFLLSVAAFSLGVSAQTGKEWDDVSIFQINREKAHTLAIPVADAKAVMENNMESSPYYLSLNGVWKFKWVANPENKPAGFENPNLQLWMQRIRNTMTVNGMIFRFPPHGRYMA